MLFAFFATCMPIWSDSMQHFVEDDVNTGISIRFAWPNTRFKCQHLAMVSKKHPDVYYPSCTMRCVGATHRCLHCGKSYCGKPCQDKDWFDKGHSDSCVHHESSDFWHCKKSLIVHFSTQ